MVALINSFSKKGDFMIPALDIPNMIPTSLKVSYKIQRGLGWLQSGYVVGPLVVSPVKALISTAEVIVALASVIFLSVAAFVMDDSSYMSRTLIPIVHIQHGLLNVVYSISNILTFGALSRKIESNLERFDQAFNENIGLVQAAFQQEFARRAPEQAAIFQQLARIGAMNMQFPRLLDE